MPGFLSEAWKSSFRSNEAARIVSQIEALVNRGPMYMSAIQQKLGVDGIANAISRFVRDGGEPKFSITWVRHDIVGDDGEIYSDQMDRLVQKGKWKNIWKA